MRKHIVAILVTGALLAAGLASTAGAPPALAADGGLRAALTLWAQRLGADGRALQAAGRPPHCLPCMGRAAQRFYVDATHARQAIAAQQPSSLAGARARTLAIAAFADWAGAGHDLVLAVRDAQRGEKEAALHHAQLAEQLAQRGARLVDESAALLAHGAPHRQPPTPQRAAPPLHGNAGRAAGLHPVRFTRLQTLTGQGGDFTIDVPTGWDFMPGQTENPIGIAPQGRQEPKAYIIALLPVADLASNFVARVTQCDEQAQSDPLGSDITACIANALQAQLDAAAKRWTAADAAGIVVNALQQQGIQFTALSVKPLSATLAEVSLTAVHGAVAADGRAIVGMQYVQNQPLSALAGRAEWASFAFVAGCEAPTGKLAATDAACAQILSSFHPSSTWLTGQITGVMAQYQQEVQIIVQMARSEIDNQARQEQIISQAESNIAQMQYQQGMQFMAANAHVAEGWINVLGGTTDLRDPTTGAIYHVYDTSRYYCLAPGGNTLLGTDNDTDLRTTACATTLTRVSP